MSRTGVDKMSKLRVTARVQLMKEIVDLLSVLTEEAKLVWKENGLHIKVVDGSRFSLLSATIGDACFETYEVEPVEIGLELGKLRGFLSVFEPSDLVELEQNQKDAINVRVGAVHRIIRVLDDTSTISKAKRPQLLPGSRATIDTSKFLKALILVRSIAELVDLRLDSNQMSVSSKVSPTNSVNVRFDAGELSELVAPNPTQSTYSLQFLYPLIIKLASGLTDSVTLEFNNNFPLIITWNSNDGGVSWEFFLASRVPKRDTEQ